MIFLRIYKDGKPRKTNTIVHSGNIPASDIVPFWEQQAPSYWTRRSGNTMRENMGNTHQSHSHTLEQSNSLSRTLGVWPAKKIDRSGPKSIALVSSSGEGTYSEIFIAIGNFLVKFSQKLNAEPV